jgi:spore maturation protein CgeB
VCFFSKINNDGWTRRALEIVALGGLLVCERTEEAKQNFKDREEAFFFSSIEELVAVVHDLKNDPAMRQKVRAAGYERLMQSDNAILSRAKQVYQFAVAKAAVSTQV